MRRPATTEEIAKRFAPLGEDRPEPTQPTAWGWLLLFPFPGPGLVLFLIFWLARVL